MMKSKVPIAPKKCIGFFPNFPINTTESKSKGPFKNLFSPNFVVPNFLALCSTTFSPILEKPANFANGGIYLCISPYSSILLTTSYLYAFKPQLKSCR